MPSVAGNEHSLPFVVVHDGNVLLVARVDWRHVQLPRSVGEEYNLLTVSIHGWYVRSRAVIAVEDDPSFASAGSSTFCL